MSTAKSLYSYFCCLKNHRMFTHKTTTTTTTNWTFAHVYKTNFAVIPFQLILGSVKIKARKKAGDGQRKEAHTQWVIFRQWPMFRPCVHVLKHYFHYLVA